MLKTRTEEYAKELSKLIRYETISVSGVENIEKFEGFKKLLMETFPDIYAVCEYENYNNAFVLHWKGKDSSLKPILFMNHHDVVEAPGAWKYPPFDGVIADGKLWGRGTLDTKGGLWAMLRAANELAKDGFVPQRDIYFESASTEETDGTGAQLVAQNFKKRGLHFEMVLDEGGMIMYDPIGGSTGTFAVVGLAEKGCADLKFVARSKGGHASTPGKNTPLVRLGKFMAAADKSYIFRSKISHVIKEMFKRLAPTMKGALKIVFGHPAFFAPLLKIAIPMMSDTGGAMLRTTLAFTMAGGSDGYNVLPQEAYVTGNMRYSHHQGGSASIKAITKLAKKYKVDTYVMDPGFDSGVTECDTAAFKMVENAVSAVFEDVITLPYIMTGASDCRFFTDLSDGCLRFAPFYIDELQLKSIHGINENVNLSSLAPAVDFYKHLMTEEQ